MSRGSHAGHVPMDVHLRPRYPGRGMCERSSTGEGLRLVPLEPLRAKRRYRPLAKEVRPPWRKRAYRHPGTNAS